MLPYIVCFGRVIPTYGMMGAAGVLFGMGLALLQCKKIGIACDDCAYLYIFGVIGAVVGAKALYFITVFPQIVNELSQKQMSSAQLVQKYLTGGLVFYGGLVGAILGAWISARYFSLRLRQFLPALIPAIPLIHAVGRIGCFCVGCCYGIPAEWGIVYTQSPYAPNNVKLIPIQLIEMGVEIVLCLFLLWFAVKGWRLRLLGFYLFSYAGLRFGLEFLRGDTARGLWLGLSTSQWISIPTALAGGILYFGVWERMKIRRFHCPVKRQENTD